MVFGELLETGFLDSGATEQPVAAENRQTEPRGVECLIRKEHSEANKPFGGNRGEGA
jgi:hypothetical protein